MWMDMPTLSYFFTTQSSSKSRASRNGDLNSEPVLEAAYESCTKKREKKFIESSLICLALKLDSTRGHLFDEYLCTVA